MSMFSLNAEKINEYKNALISFFKDNDLEVKDWHFNVESIDNSYYLLDFGIKLKVKKKAVQNKEKKLE